MNSSMIPDIIWPSVVRDDLKKSQQMLACIFCTIDADDTPSLVIVMINGTSYCQKHAVEMLKKL